MMDGRFSQRTFVVTGGASGIGAATARRAHAEGARVVIADQDHEAAAALVLQLGPDRTLHLATDVSQQESVERCIDAALSRFGRIDVLVNSAGIGDRHHTLELPIEKWQKVMRVNVDGVFLMSQTLLRNQPEAAGNISIVNVSSTAGLIGVPQRAAYTVSKHAVVGITRQMALDFARRGVRVNAVCPGLVRTPMTQSYFEDPEHAERMRQSSPLGREAAPEEIAAAILFLASDDASFISGVALPVDAGFTAGKGR